MSNMSSSMKTNKTKLVHRRSSRLLLPLLLSKTMTTMMMTTMMTMIMGTVAAVVNPTLPLGDINILAVTDVHSFVGGHPHEVDRNADYGDLLSFHAHLKGYIEEQNRNEGSSSSSSSRKRDLWLVNNGDWIHGTGLAMDGNATALLPIITAVPWDIMTMGNHEAMYTAVVEDIRDTIVPTMSGKFMSSNILWENTQTPIGGSRYELLRGPQTNQTLLVMGFLYDSASVSEALHVVPVEKALSQPWFSRAVHESYDAILVMAHMDNDDPLLGTIYQAIRSEVDPKMPVQFITGHSHQRKYTENWKRKDHYVRKMEPGGLFDTIGFVSIPTFSRAKEQHVATMNVEFGHAFLNTSKTVLTQTLGFAVPGETNDDNKPTTPLRTPEGDALAQLIHSTQESLGLNQLVACPGRDYFRNVSIFAQDSLWKLWRDHVIPSQLFSKGEDRVMLIGKGSFRYDLRGSGKNDAMTLDDVVAIAPYMERVIYVGTVPDWMVRRMNNTFNTYSHHNLVPDYVLAGNLDPIATVDSYQLYTHEGDLDKVVGKLKKFNFQDFAIQRTGKRDTLYWLDYVMKAFPCPGKEEGFEILPYFYDPSELDEEDTDGKLTDEDEDVSVDPELPSEDEEDPWTLPPDTDYIGYIPGKGEANKIPEEKYTNYEPPTDDDDVPSHSNQQGPKKSDVKARLERRKKLQRSVLKVVALTMATAVLLVPVVCLLLQITGRLTDNDDDDEIVFYDRREMTALRRERKRMGNNGNDRLPLTRTQRPIREIEIT